MEVADFNEFVVKLSESGFTAELAWQLRLDPSRIKRMIEATTPPPDLIHGRFTPLTRKLEMVRSYPGITPEMLEKALAEATASGLLARYEAESPKNSFLEVAVTVYRGSVPETLLYARDRMREAHGKEFWQWKEAYEEGVDEKRVRLVKDVPEHRDCIRIEVFDAAKKGDRSLEFYTFAPIFAAAQSPEWVRQMWDHEHVSPRRCDGLELNVRGEKEWSCVPYVDRYQGQSMLHGCWYDR